MTHQSENTIQVVDIVEGTTVDGPGFRTSIYFAGCRHQCPGCHNPQTWSFEAGNQMSVSEIMAIIRRADFNVTFTGGDPLYHAVELLPLANEIRAIGKNIWVYTGFGYDEAMTLPGAQQLLDMADVLVDGAFIEELRDTTLLFRGSSNQRLIDLAETRRTGTIRLWSLPEIVF